MNQQLDSYLAQLPKANPATDAPKVEEITATGYPYYARKDTLKVQNAFLVGNWTPTPGMGCVNHNYMAILISHIKEVSDLSPCSGGSTLVKCELK